MGYAWHEVCYQDAAAALDCPECGNSAPVVTFANPNYRPSLPRSTIPDSSHHAKFGKRLFCYCIECAQAIKSPCDGVIHCIRFGIVRESAIARNCEEFEPCI